MSIILDLQPELERKLSARARAKGVSLADYAQEVLAREAQMESKAGSQAADLYDLFAPVRGLLTDKEIERNFSRNVAESRLIDLR